MRAKLIKESIEYLNESKKESYSITKSEDNELEIKDAEKNVIKKAPGKEIINFLTQSGGMTNINAKSLVEDLIRGDIKIKLFIANPKIFKTK
ncbi:MAG: hypothetical protein PHF86_02580 [Candidatus Nanoarchaeia archaeon]|nr:hypothetical protein [Candidatus Nanoarchaeia archaeon]